MVRSLLLAIAVSLGSAAPLAAAKLSDEFRTAFERTYRKGRYAVVVQPGLPTTSIYGVEGNQTEAHYSIDIRDGEWKTSEGFLDTDQTAADFLERGEVMELASASYKDNRVDLRMVSLEAKKVTRGSGFLTSEKREPVATNFKFFFPFEKSRVLTPADMPEVEGYIGAYLRFFADERGARDFSAQMRAGGATTGRAAPPGPPTRKEIKPGMTALEVIEILGKPDKEVSFGSTTQWKYPDLQVIFESGRVKEVKF
jgi:hypothetical protein